MQALLLSHPRKMTRDTATYPPLMMSMGRGSKPRPRSLRHLAESELGLTIQAGEHSPVDDARSTLYLYHKHRKVILYGLCHCAATYQAGLPVYDADSPWYVCDLHTAQCACAAVEQFSQPELPN